MFKRQSTNTFKDLYCFNTLNDLDHMTKHLYKETCSENSSLHKHGSKTCFWCITMVKLKQVMKGPHLNAMFQNHLR